MTHALVLVFALGTAVTQPPSPSAAGGTPAAATNGTAAVPGRAADPVDESAPVAVPEPSEKALQYNRSGTLIWAGEQVWSVAVLLVILFSGFSATIRTWARAIGRRWYFTLVAYVALFSIITFVIDLPLSYYTGFVRQHAYGLSNQAFGKWWGDSLKALGVGIVATSLFLWVPYVLLRRSPKRWWIYTAVAAIPFVVAIQLVAPVWVAPLFNKFEPMQDKALEAKILALADRAGIEGSRVYQVNKSVDTKTLNAYVTGLGATKRIVLWDTIISRMTERELLFVMGHEMGHYVLGHTFYMVFLSAGIILVTLYGVYLTIGAALRRWGDRFGFTDVADIASLPLLLLLMNVTSFVITPGIYAVTRHFEHEADRFGLEITRSSHSAGTAFVKLQTDALGIPRPGLLNKLWRQTHPPVGERIDFTNSYHPWRTGEPLVYERYFR